MHVALLLGGDFNCPGIDWSTGNLIESYLPLIFRKSLIEFAQDFLLEQIILEPTRGDNIILDHILALYTNIKLFLALVIMMLSLSKCCTIYLLIEGLRSMCTVITEQTGIPCVKKWLKSPGTSIHPYWTSKLYYKDLNSSSSLNGNKPFWK